MTCSSFQIIGVSGWVLATALMLIVVFLSVWSLAFRDNVKDKLTAFVAFALRRNRI